MKEFIEREATRQAHIKASLTTRLIDAQPTADVVEVKHGRWIKHELYDECELCHVKTIYGGNYCPNCGARMDGKETEYEAG